MRALADEWSACAAPSANVNYSGGVQPGGPNMAQLMQQAQKMQQQLVAAQEELAAAEVTGTAGGGLVTAVMSGTGELRSMTIDPSVLDPDDTETVQDLVVAAVLSGNRNFEARVHQSIKANFRCPRRGPPGRRPQRGEDGTVVAGPEPAGPGPARPMTRLPSRPVSVPG